MTQYTPGVLVKNVKPAPRSSLRLLLLALLLLALLLLLLTPVVLLVETSLFTSRADMSDEKSLDLATSLSAFTLDMYKVLSEKAPEKNLFFSPLSVMTALSMTLMGAKQASRDQLAVALKLHPHSNDAVKTAFAAALDAFNKMPEGVQKLYELHVANNMYVSHKLDLQQEFSDALTQHFQAAAKVVDFGGQTEAVRQEINQAVEEATKNKIKNLIPEGILDALTRLVLVNAVYFKGLWTKPFDKARTQDLPFYTDETNSVNVPMMKAKEEYRYMIRKDLEATVLGMDYQGGNLSLVIVLPDKRTGLAEVERRLQGVDLRELFDSGRKVKVEVTIPRFKLEYSEDLVAPLKSLGVSNMFGSSADLSGIGGLPGDLYVSNVLHKAFIDVNEEGSEAAAATAVVIKAAAAVRYPEFTANRPFFFMLGEKKKSGVILFCGRLTQPQASA
ncbi:leukocyte elastase inhibitor isoform X3 [Hyalella azteca]|uniref:Leukocyte elastase inhibitor isoform X3 n=1 Tax=Hyalella azteca TaxID=294128 RepID=A0A8B7NTV4_HYAAZ|nr:leukocyte elastase inhibitor isoform X3 [Hyalella azteca]